MIYGQCPLSSNNVYLITPPEPSHQCLISLLATCKAGLVNHTFPVLNALELGM